MLMQEMSEAAEKHGMTMMSDASTKLGQGGKKMQARTM
jgi:hypothetical protein